jgi:hypothetical protein
MKHIRILSTALVVLAVGGSTALQAQDGRGRGDDQAHKDQRDQHAQVPPQEQQRRVQEEQQRSVQYRQQLDQHMQAVRQQTNQLQQDNRMAQYRAQQEYAARLQQQQQQQQARAERDYSRDPYITTPHSFRYNIGGTYHQTNQYGVDVLRQAVNNGYLEGMRAGRADHQDRWKANYQGSAAYQDANYGYTGNYVDRTDYNYYFRQGFQRGYDDGYNSRLQYGSNLNGNSSILGNILTSILGLQPIP